MSFANVSPRYYCKSVHRLHNTAAWICRRYVFFWRRRYIVGCLLQMYQLNISANVSPRYYCKLVYSLHNTPALICRWCIFLCRRRYIVRRLLQRSFDVALYSIKSKSCKAPLIEYRALLIEYIALFLRLKRLGKIELFWLQNTVRFGHNFCTHTASFTNQTIPAHPTEGHDFSLFGLCPSLRRSH